MAENGTEETLPFVDHDPLNEETMGKYWIVHKRQFCERGDLNILPPNVGVFEGFQETSMIPDQQRAAVTSPD